MPRLKTKGESLGFRLELNHDEILRAIAHRRNMTGRELAAQIVTDWVKEQMRTPAHAAAARHSKRERTGSLTAEFFGEGVAPPETES